MKSAILPCNFVKGTQYILFQLAPIVLLVFFNPVKTASAQDSYTPATHYHIVTDQPASDPNLPDASHASTGDVSTRHIGSIDGTYYISRQPGAKGPDFNVDAWNYFKMKSAGIPDIVSTNTEIAPAKIINELNNDKYLELRYIPSRAYMQLCPTDQYALIQLIKSDIPFAVYQSGFNENFSKVVILTDDWKMIMKFSHQGILKRVTKKIR